MKPISSHEFFAKLNGEEFENYAELRKKVLHEFNKNLGAFPPQYTYLDLIEWGKQRNWIIALDRGRFCIQVDHQVEIMQH